MSKVRKQHMTVNWHEIVDNDKSACAIDAPLKEKATLVGRVGIMMLSVGTGAWRVRHSMNSIARKLGITCSVDIGLLAITWTCLQDNETYTQTYSLPTSAVNTHKLMQLELFVKDFANHADTYSTDKFHKILDDIQNLPANYKPIQLGIAAAIACCAFTFLLDGGLIEMICAFLGAGVGNFVRCKMIHNKETLFANVGMGVAAACVTYGIAIMIMQAIFGVSEAHQAGYICSMLFVIPGFPLITGGIDLAKLDLRSGLERITYALLIIFVATTTGWVVALIFHLEPGDLVKPAFSAGTLTVLRLIASFFGVYNFSLMFNSPRKIAFTAGIIGMIANTLRLELIGIFGLPIGVAAFIGAFSSGCMASVIKKKVGYPRISLTVPSIVIMVPGLYMYRGIYQLGLSNIGEASTWLTKAVLIVVALPLGLVFARICTDRNFRKCS